MKEKERRRKKENKIYDNLNIIFKITELTNENNKKKKKKILIKKIEKLQNM